MSVNGVVHIMKMEAHKEMLLMKRAYHLSILFCFVFLMEAAVYKLCDGE